MNWIARVRMPAALAFVGLVLLFAATTVESQSSYRVIVHPSNGVSSLSKAELSDLFLKKTTRWDSSKESVEPVDLASPPEVRNAFSEDVHGRSANSVKKYWQRLIFTGRGTPPEEMKSERDVVAFVAANPGAIGYVSPSASTSGVKTVSVN